MLCVYWCIENKIYSKAVAYFSWKIYIGLRRRNSRWLDSINIKFVEFLAKAKKFGEFLAKAKKFGEFLAKAKKFGEFLAKAKKFGEFLAKAKKFGLAANGSHLMGVCVCEHCI